MDEFDLIARLFRPLTGGAPEALGLIDDAAVIPSKPGFDLVVTKDAMVEGVHFLSSDPPALIARKLLRVNLSDLAAKAAEPYAYFLAVAWPQHWDEAGRAAFASGLAEDQATYGLTLLGGDTVSTPGPLTLSATLLGWVPAGKMVKRSGAKAGDVLMVSGVIGDGRLGLAAARGEPLGIRPEHARYLAGRYRLPEPRTVLCNVLRAYATAAADVSDGLLADAGHLGEASGLGVAIDLDRTPLSPAAQAWLAVQADPATALGALASGGDDYEVVFTVRPLDVEILAMQARAAGVPVTAVGRMTDLQGLRVAYQGQDLKIDRLGWTHP